MALSSASTWIFGYGSLIYRPGFEFSRRVEGYIKGYRRVFHQGSTDHRGTPEYPGRTATLAPCPTSVVWGAAYELVGDTQQQAETLKYLELREQQYDVRLLADLFSAQDAQQPLVRGCLVYIASQDRSRNVNYLGPAPEEAIALQIATAVGPSGRNCEYVLRLADAMRQMGVEDVELFRLEARVRALREQQQEQEAYDGQETTVEMHAGSITVSKQQSSSTSTGSIALVANTAFVAAEMPPAGT